MAENGHTAGPWEVKEGSYIYAPDGSYIAKTTGNMKRYQGRQMDEANARLIATAPELLAALEEIWRNCDPWKEADNMAGRLFKIVDFAIRKAKGAV